MKLLGLITNGDFIDNIGTGRLHDITESTRNIIVDVRHD
jgi:hypothetical protein